MTHRIARSGKDFEKRLETVRSGLRVPFPWYPYGSLNNMGPIDRMFGGDLERLIRMASSGTVLDLGCGDGDLSFFLESVGCKVHAVDYRVTNHNYMRGVQALRKALNSRIEIHDIDIDAYFQLPAPRYGLTLFLGILYHLKNPFYALEYLAQHSRYCILSTRIANTIPPLLPDAREFPGAYLLDTAELNRDYTNYWIFTETGLRRLLKRTCWSVIAGFTVGASLSDPWSLDRDQRFFCLAESTHGPIAGCEVELLDGWYEPESPGWRWTKRRFSIAMNTPVERCPLLLTMNLWLHEEILKDGPVTLSASAGGVTLDPEIFSEAGDHVYFRLLRSEMPGAAVRVEFSLDRALAPTAADDRELGLVVASLHVDPRPDTGAKPGQAGSVPR